MKAYQLRSHVPMSDQSDIPSGEKDNPQTIQSIEGYWRELAEHNMQMNYELHRENAELKAKIEKYGKEKTNESEHESEIKFWKELALNAADQNLDNWKKYLAECDKNEQLTNENTKLKGQINFDQSVNDIEKSANKADCEELLRLRKENEELKAKIKEEDHSTDADVYLPPVTLANINSTHLNITEFPPCLRPYGELLNNRFAIIWEAITSLRRLMDGQQTELDEYEKRIKELDGK